MQKHEISNPQVFASMQKPEVGNPRFWHNEPARAVNAKIRGCQPQPFARAQLHGS